MREYISSSGGSKDVVVTLVAENVVVLERDLSVASLRPANSRMRAEMETEAPLVLERVTDRLVLVEVVGLAEGRLARVRVGTKGSEMRAPRRMEVGGWSKVGGRM